MTALIRLKKLMSSDPQAAYTPGEGHSLPYQRQQQHTSLCEEIERLSAILPDHGVLGITEAEHKRFRTALNKVGGFTLAQLQTMGAISDRSVASTLKAVRQAEKHGIDSCIQEILDPKKGYPKAHTWARGTPKAPPLPTEMWKGGIHWAPASHNASAVSGLGCAVDATAARHSHGTMDRDQGTC